MLTDKELRLARKAAASLLTDGHAGSSSRPDKSPWVRPKHKWVYFSNDNGNYSVSIPIPNSSPKAKVYVGSYKADEARAVQGRDAFLKKYGMPDTWCGKDPTKK